MALEIPEGFTLANYVNMHMGELLSEINRLQVYINDWDKLPQDFKDFVKLELASFLDNSGSFLSDIKNYLGSL